MAPEGVIGPLPVTPVPAGLIERRWLSWLEEPPFVALFPPDD